MVCTKITERMALDLLRAASADERSISDYLYRLLRRDLYGRIASTDQAHEIQGQTK
jgi:hypothetical protein